MTQRHPIQHDQIVMITTVTKKRLPIFSSAVYAREAIECLYRTQERHPFFLYAFVIMPDHLHLLVKTIAPSNISKIVGFYKSGLAHHLGIGPLWQPRFHMRIADDAEKLKEYIHCNPTRKGLSESCETYPWSSASGRWEITALE